VPINDYTGTILGLYETSDRSIGTTMHPQRPNKRSGERRERRKKERKIESKEKRVQI